MEWRSKVVVITGASSGIGERVALDLAALGSRVCVAARREQRLRELVDRMGGEAAGHSLKVTDVSNREDVAGFARFVDERYGRCDVLLNNAGFNRPRRLEEEDSIEILERIMATNFFGAVYCTKELLPLLLRSAPSSVVNVASVAGRLAVGGVAGYTASKFALVGWSESLHHDLKPAGVFVSLVEPGAVPTEGFPQSALRSHPFLSWAVGDVAQVSKAIRDAVERRKLQRVVPRWYYLLQIPRLLAPPMFRYAQRKIVDERRASGGSEP